MLELRPTCEHCNTALPPDSAEARICSFECTFCARCVDGLLANVCPNCGGGFVPRPVRLAASGAMAPTWARAGEPGRQAPPVDLQRHAQLVAAQGGLPPHRR